MYTAGASEGGKQCSDGGVFTYMHAYCNWPTCGYVIYTNLLSVPVQAATAPMY